MNNFKNSIIGQLSKCKCYFTNYTAKLKVRHAANAEQKKASDKVERRILEIDEEKLLSP